MAEETRAARLVSAASLPVTAAAIMLGVGSWNGELLATACLIALPLALVGNERVARRAPRRAWVPPWERSIRGRATRMPTR